MKKIRRRKAVVKNDDGSVMKIKTYHNGRLKKIKTKYSDDYENVKEKEKFKRSGGLKYRNVKIRKK
jgi:hypothetical protein